jgi:hypothetical protein
LEKKARDERRKKLEAVLAQNPMQGIKMDDHAYWEDKERLVEGVKNAVREAVEGVEKDGGRVEGISVSVKGGGMKREIKFSGFDEEYDDSSEEEEEGDEDDEDIEDEGIEEEEEEDEYEGSTEDESPTEGKGKEIAT